MELQIKHFIPSLHAAGASNRICKEFAYFYRLSRTHFSRERRKGNIETATTEKPIENLNIINILQSIHRARQLAGTYWLHGFRLTNCHKIESISPCTSKQFVQQKKKRISSLFLSLHFPFSVHVYRSDYEEIQMLHRETMHSYLPFICLLIFICNC